MSAEGMTRHELISGVFSHASRVQSMSKQVHPAYDIQQQRTSMPHDLLEKINPSGMAKGPGGGIAMCIVQ